AVRRGRRRHRLSRDELSRRQQRERAAALDPDSVDAILVLRGGLVANRPAEAAGPNVAACRTFSRALRTWPLPTRRLLACSRLRGGSTNRSTASVTSALR